MDYNKYITKKSLIMNSGTSSTELNDMLTDFVKYVDSFYGVNDPLYPMINVRQSNHYQKLTFSQLQSSTYHNVVMIESQIVCGGMETHLTERESETFYFMITTTSL